MLYLFSSPLINFPRPLDMNAEPDKWHFINSCTVHVYMSSINLVEHTLYIIRMYLLLCLNDDEHSNLLQLFKSKPENNLKPVRNLK